MADQALECLAEISAAPQRPLCRMQLVPTPGSDKGWIGAIQPQCELLRLAGQTTMAKPTSPWAQRVQIFLDHNTNCVLAIYAPTALLPTMKCVVTPHPDIEVGWCCIRLAVHTMTTKPTNTTIRLEHADKEKDKDKDVWAMVSMKNWIGDSSFRFELNLRPSTH